MGSGLARVLSNHAGRRPLRLLNRNPEHNMTSVPFPAQLHFVVSVDVANGRASTDLVHMQDGLQRAADIARREGMLTSHDDEVWSAATNGKPPRLWWTSSSASLGQRSKPTYSPTPLVGV